MHQKNSWFFSAERIITLPIIFAALWQLLACMSAVFISNFSVIIGTSFILSILGTFVVAVYFPFEKLKFKDLARSIVLTYDVGQCSRVVNQNIIIF